MADGSDGQLSFSTIYMRVMLFFALRDGKLTEKEISLVRDIHQQVMGEDIPAPALINEVEWVQQHRLPGLLALLEAVNRAMPETHKDLLLKSGLLMVLADEDEREIGLKSMYVIFDKLGFSREQISIKMKNAFGAVTNSYATDAQRMAQKRREEMINQAKWGQSERPDYAKPQVIRRGIGGFLDRISLAKVSIVTVVIVLMGLGGYYYLRAYEYGQLIRDQDLDVAALSQEIDNQKEELEAAHKKRMANLDITSGAFAREQHDREWAERLALNPVYAKTKTEKTLLKVVEIAGDTSLADKNVLKEVATLVAPPEAKIKVIPYYGGYKVDVRFDMAKMTDGEEGSRTKHHTVASLKQEVQDILGYVMKDLYQHCNSRDLKRIDVHCEHGVRTKGRFGLPDMTIMQSIYAARMTSKQAKRIYNWSTVSNDSVIKTWSVINNEFSNLKIGSSRI